jgi:hypothetical protein
MLIVDQVIASFHSWKRSKHRALEALGGKADFHYKNLTRDLSTFYHERYQSVPSDQLPDLDVVEREIRSRSAQKAAITRKKRVAASLKIAARAQESERQGTLPF